MGGMNSSENIAISPHVCLYVGNLDPTITEEDLRRKVSIVGEIDKVSLHREAGVENSLCYAFVYYKKMADAEKAFQYFNANSIKLLGKPILVRWANRNSETESQGKLFIRNLPLSVTNNDLHALFSRFGQISLCKVERGDTSQSSGYGFVYFETIQAAHDAVQKMNGKMIQGMQISVDKCMQRVLVSDEEDDETGYDDDDYQSSDDSDDDYFTNVFIKNFGHELNDDSLKELFSPFGEITSHSVKTNEIGESLGFGFVAFKSYKSAKMAAEVMNGKKINNCKLVVCRWQSKGEREKLLKDAKWERSKGCNLYVKNLPESLDDFRLNREFSRFGDVTSVKIMRNDKGVSKCFGFVCFRSPEVAKIAKNAMHGKKIKGKEIYVAYAQKKEDRKAILTLQKSVERQLKEKLRI